MNIAKIINIGNLSFVLNNLIFITTKEITIGKIYLKSLEDE